jgi:hypothetical protein
MMPAAGRRILLAAGLAAWAAAVCAERPVYKNVDPAGNVTYSDRRSGAGDAPVKNWLPANPSAYAYDTAVLRAERDRIYYQQQIAARHQPVPVVVFDPRGWQTTRAQAPDQTLAPRWRSRWDANLPASPAPSLERNYYYNGR